MLTSTLARALRPAARSYHGKASTYVQPHMNELPVPNGSWQEVHNANQRKYNAALLFGIAFSAFTLFTAKTSGLIYFNYSPPKSLD